MSTKKNVCIIGSGNWGSAIAKIIGKNVKRFDQFNETVKMYVFEEMVNGQKLTEIINTQHENIKYLPGHKLPANVVAVPDVLDAAGDADILVFVLPHQFIRLTVKPLLGKVKPGAIGISLIKGVDIKDGNINLISRVIKDLLNIEMSVLMGANLAPEVADEKFCETTIGCRDPRAGQMLKDLMQADYFLVTVVDDVEAVELCGALKNIVACAAGFVDGLKYGDNTKSAIIRLGLMEMIAFCQHFYPSSKPGTFFESCGVADLITTCYGGRNRRVSEAFVKTGKTIEELEKEMLNGQRLQGPETAHEVNAVLVKQGLDSRFPLFTAVHNICRQDIPATELIPCLQKQASRIVSSKL